MSSGRVSDFDLSAGADLRHGGCPAGRSETVSVGRLFPSADISVLFYLYREYKADPGGQWFPYLDCPGKGTFDWDPYKSDHQQCDGGNPAVRFQHRFFGASDRGEPGRSVKVLRRDTKEKLYFCQVLFYTFIRCMILMRAQYFRIR